MGKKIGAKKKLKKLEKNGCEKDAASELLFGLGVNSLKWCEKDAASELLFGLGVNSLKWPEMELIFF